MLSLLHSIIMLFILFNFQTTGIALTKLVLFKDGHSMYADIESNYAMDEKTRSTLVSGVPLQLAITVKLFDASNTEKNRIQIYIDINYDVWNEMYTLQFPDRLEKFRSHDSLKRTLNSLKHVVLFPLEQMQTDTECYISMKLRMVNATSGSVIDSMDRSTSTTGFGLSAIIKFFFGSSDEETHWHRSDKFLIDRLEKR
jgi:hypothetical protein